MTKSYDSLKYHPQIEAIIDRMPANKFVEDILDSKDYISPSEAKEKIKETIKHVDFLIYKSEKEINKLDFEDIDTQDFIKVVRKKYYCQQELTNKEEKLLEKFKELAQDIDVDANSVDYYPRLLATKEDLEDDKNYVDQLEEIDDESYKRIIADYASETFRKVVEEVDSWRHIEGEPDYDEHRIRKLDTSEGRKNLREDISSNWQKGTEHHFTKNVGNLIDDTLNIGTTGVGRDGEEYDGIDMNVRSDSLDIDRPGGKYKGNLASVNNQLRHSERERKEYISLYEEAIDDGRPEDAKKYLEKAQKIKEDTDKLLNNKLGTTASMSFLAYAKAESTDNYISKIGYLSASTLLDSIGGNLCCFIRLILQTIGMEDEDDEYSNLLEYIEKKGGELHHELDKFNNKMDQFNEKFRTDKWIKAIDAIRGLLAMAYNEDEEKANKLLDSVNGIIMAPIKSAVQVGINLLREIENIIIDEIVDQLGVWIEQKSRPSKDGDFKEGFAECYTFELLADFIFDKIEEFFSKLELQILNLYKLTYSKMEFHDEDELLLGEKRWIKNTYTYLTLISEGLKGINEFEAVADIEGWANSLLRNAGLGYSYNPRTGQVEEVSLDDCFDWTPVNGESKNTKFNDSDNMKELDFENDVEYQNWLENIGSLEISCDFKDEDIEIEEEMESIVEDPAEIQSQALKAAKEIADDSNTKQ